VYSTLAGPREVTVDAAPLERLDATMLHFTLPEGSRLAGLYPSELRLPGDAAVSLIQRDGKLFVPGQHSIGPGCGAGSEKSGRLPEFWRGTFKVALLDGRPS
jgi:hypothetical protein